MNCKEYQDDVKRMAENDAAAKATQEMLDVRETALLFLKPVDLISSLSLSLSLSLSSIEIGPEW